jgi:methylenetetrahydrofolate reductase (NADPH)
MRIDELLRSSDEPVFSFEFFPPKSEQGEVNLETALQELVPLAPAFVSVTYGAGGSTREKTIDIVSRINRDFGLEAMAHLTCVNATVDDLRGTLDQMRDAGIDNVLALRGDPPQGQERWTKTEGGLEYSLELIELLREHYGFSIGGAAFPETHIHATSPEEDLQFLKAKVDAGAQFLITQMFFDNRYYFDFVARARATSPSSRASCRSSAAAASGAWPSCRRPGCPTACSARSRSARTTRRSPSSASPTRRCSAPSCSPAARPASTSSR